MHLIIAAYVVLMRDCSCVCLGKKIAKQRGHLVIVKIEAVIYDICAYKGEIFNCSKDCRNQ